MKTSKVLLFLLLITFSNPIIAATITSNGTGGGQWGLGSSWTGGTPPAPGDDVIISNGDVISLGASETCNDLLIQDNNSQLIIGSNTLNINGNFTAQATSNNCTNSISNNGVINISAESRVQTYGFTSFNLNITGTGIINGGTYFWFISRKGSVSSNVANSLLMINRNIRFLSYSSSTVSVTFSDSIACSRFELYAFGTSTDVQVNGTAADFRLNAQRIIELRRGGIFNGGSSGSQVFIRGNIIAGGNDITYHNLHALNNILLNSSLNLQVNGTLFIGSSLSFDLNGNNLSLSGSLQVNGTLSMNTGDQFTFNSTGAAKQIIDGIGTLSFTNLIMDCSNATGGVTVNSPIEISENLICTDGTLTTNNNISLLSNASGTANIGEISAGASISGNIIVNKWFAGMNGVADWVYYNRPGIPGLLNEVNDGGSNPAGFYTFGYNNSNSPSTVTYKSTYRYNESAAAAASGTNAERFEAGWVAATDANTEAFDPSNAWIFLIGGNTGAGAKDTYHLRHNIQPFNAGAVFSGSGSNAATYRGWNLFGNPYASAVTVANSMMTAIQGNAFVVYDRTSGYTALTAGDILPSFQSFFVQVQNATNQVTFAQSDKSTNHTTQIYKKIKHADRMDIHLTRDYGSFQGHAYLRFDSQGDVGFDGGDLYHLRNSWPRPNIALIEQDSLPFMIDNVPTNFEDLVIPIRVEAYDSDWHTIEFENIPDASSCFVLEDLETGDLIELSTQNSYRFYLSDTTNSPRFLLHISKGIMDSQSSPVSCFGSTDGQAVVELNPNKTYDIVWFDEAQNIVREKQNVTSSDTLSQAAAGNYHVQVIAQSGECATLSEDLSIFEPAEVDPEFEISNVVPNVWAKEIVEFSNSSTGATDFKWNFGDGSPISTDINPQHAYAEAGTYVVELSASNGNPDCDASKLAVVKAVKQAPASLEEVELSKLSVLNKSGNYFLQLNEDLGTDLSVQVTNLLGQNINNSEWLTSDNKEFQLVLPSNGIYIINVSGDDFNESIKLSSQNK